MRKRRAGRLSYSNVMSTIAAFLAIGGTAFAAATIGSGDVINNSLKGIDVKKNTLTGADVREGSLAKVPRARRADSAGSAAIAEDAAFADHASFADAAPVTGYQRVYGGDTVLPPSTTTTLTADCPPGKTAISGGYYTNHIDAHVFWHYVTDNNTYTVAFRNRNSVGEVTVGVHVVCVNIAG